jgi:transposase InsO family protein
MRSPCLDEVMQAVLDFRDNYNRYWRLEKLGFMTPLEARQRYRNERLPPVAA